MPRGKKRAWEELPPRPCDYCGESYTPKRPNQRFCRDAHRYAYHSGGPKFQVLKKELEQMVEQRIAKLRQELQPSRSD